MKNKNNKQITTENNSHPKKIKANKKNNDSLKKHITNKKGKPKRKIKKIKTKKEPPKRKSKMSKNSTSNKNINNESLLASKSKIELMQNNKSQDKPKIITDLHNQNKKKLKEYNKIMFFNDFELNIMQYKDALKHDKRTYFEFYLSLLKTKHMLYFTIFNRNDYNSLIIKLCITFFTFGLYYTINALFYTDSALHEIYLEDGEYGYIYQIPKIIYSCIISHFLIIFIKYLSLSEKNILNYKRDKSILTMNNLIKYLKIKFMLFFILSYIFLFIFWLYISCFCLVYKNTQLFLLKDTLISFVISLVYPLGLYLIPGLFRILSLSDKANNKECLYNLSIAIQLLL